MISKLARAFGDTPWKPQVLDVWRYHACVLRIREKPGRKRVGFFGARGGLLILCLFDNFILFRDLNRKAQVTFLFVLEKWAGNLFFLKKVNQRSSDYILSFRAVSSVAINVY